MLGVFFLIFPEKVRKHQRRGCIFKRTDEKGTVKNYAQIRLQVRQNKVCIGQDTALDIPAAEDGADVKGGAAACEALDV